MLATEQVAESWRAGYLHTGRESKPGFGVFWKIVNIKGHCNVSSLASIVLLGHVC